jgi:Phage integrase family
MRFERTSIGEADRVQADEIRDDVKREEREAEQALTKRAGCPTRRHSFAAHLLEGGYDIRTIQELLGPEGVNATIITTHVLDRGGRGARCPFDGVVGHRRAGGRPSGGADVSGGTSRGWVGKGRPWQG